MLDTLSVGSLNWTSSPFGVVIPISLVGLGRTAEIVVGEGRHDLDDVGGDLTD